MRSESMTVGLSFAHFPIGRLAKHLAPPLRILPE
jgi:hypothetical protein